MYILSVVFGDVKAEKTIPFSLAIGLKVELSLVQTSFKLIVTLASCPTPFVESITNENSFVICDKCAISSDTFLSASDAFLGSPFCIINSALDALASAMPLCR